MGKVEKIQSTQTFEADSLSVVEFLKLKMADAHLTALMLANQIDVHPQTLYNVTTGKRPISSKLALKLANRFDEPVQLWLSEIVNIAEIKPISGLQAPDGETRGASVTPLFSEHGRSESGLLVDREIRAMLESADSMRISPFDSRNVEPASYDLTVGLIIERGFKEMSQHDWTMALRLYYEPDKLEERERDRIATVLDRKANSIEYFGSRTLQPGESRIVVTREIVQFDKFYLAFAGGTSHNAMRGLIVNHGLQIDPGYSGALFVRASNLDSDPIDVAAGDKIVSLAIMRLPRAPERAYQEDNAARFLRIAEGLERGLTNLFQYKPVGDGEFKAECESLGLSYVCASRDAAEARAVDVVLAALEAPHPDIEEALNRALLEILDSVTIDKSDTKALIRRFGVLDPVRIESAKKVFVYKNDRQTLHDTLSRLQLDLLQCLVKLLE